jgi:ribonuclease HI
VTISKYIGNCHNSFAAEIRAVEAAIEELRDNPATVFCDCTYAINVLFHNASFCSNKKIIERVRSKLEGKTIEARWVRGHSGNKWNSMADGLAKAGAKNRWNVVNVEERN